MEESADIEKCISIHSEEKNRNRFARKWAKDEGLRKQWKEFWKKLRIILRILMDREIWKRAVRKSEGG